MARWRAFRGQENISVTPHREDRSIATRLKVESSASFSRKQLSVVHLRYQSYHTPHILILCARQQQYSVCSQSHLTLHVPALFTHAPYHTYTHRRTLDDVDEILSLVSRPRLRDYTQLVLNLLLTRPCTRLTRRHCAASRPPRRRPTLSLVLQPTATMDVATATEAVAASIVMNRCMQGARHARPDFMGLAFRVHAQVLKQRYVTELLRKTCMQNI